MGSSWIIPNHPKANDECSYETQRWEDRRVEKTTERRTQERKRHERREHRRGEGKEEGRTEERGGRRRGRDIGEERRVPLRVRTGLRVLQPQTKEIMKRKMPRVHPQDSGRIVALPTPVFETSLQNCVGIVPSHAVSHLTCGGLLWWHHQTAFSHWMNIQQALTIKL